MFDYVSILKPDESFSSDQIKGIYRKLVKENHPDLFPEEKRREQNLILMEINEAYLIVLSKTDKNTNSSFKASDTLSNFRDLTPHQNPDYAYYRTAFRLYQEGQFVFNSSRYSLKNLKKTFDTDTHSILKTARKALNLYILSFRYFSKIVNEYPESIWKADSLEKLDYIIKLNERYNKIINILISGQDSS